MKILHTLLFLSLGTLLAFGENLPSPLGKAIRARLLSPATVSLEIDGKVAGKTKLPPGTILDVLRETEKSVLLKSRFGEHWLSKEKLEIERAASTPISSTAPSAPTNQSPSASSSQIPAKSLSSPLELDPFANLEIAALSSADIDGEILDSNKPASDERPSSSVRVSYDSTPLANEPLDDLESDAIAGNPLAQIELAHRYRRGFGVDKNIALAAQWYAKASHQGDPGGDMCLARMNLSGLTTLEPYSWENAFRLLDQIASNSDRSAALHYAGMCYLLGRGTPVNFRKAANLFEAFALSRDYNPYQRESMWELGKIYETGKGVTRNKAKAIEWFEKAALNGHSESRKWLQSAAQKGDRDAINALEKITANKKMRGQ